MEITQTFYARDRKAWRTWLQKNHASESEIWLLYYKKHTGKPTVTYDEAVEEALCFGWIDGIEKSVDEERFAQRFTPRKLKSKWSESNLTRIRKLIADGSMTPAGMAKIDFDPATRKAEPRPDYNIVPPWMLKALKSDATAWKFWNALTPGCRRDYVHWVTEAKREETRQRRLTEALTLLRKGKKLGMK